MTRTFRFFLDTEFIEGPVQGTFRNPVLRQLASWAGFQAERPTVQLISLGLVSETRETLYLVSKDFNPADASDWVLDNVLYEVSKLGFSFSRSEWLAMDREEREDTIRAVQLFFGYHEAEIAAKVLGFISEQTEGAFKWTLHQGGRWMQKLGRGADAKLEFHGYYADYDWVCLCFLFGRMGTLPEGFPYYCQDLKQKADFLGVTSEDPRWPKQQDEHDALDDAFFNFHLFHLLERRMRERLVWVPDAEAGQMTHAQEQQLFAQILRKQSDEQARVTALERVRKAKLENPQQMRQFLESLEQEPLENSIDLLNQALGRDGKVPDDTPDDEAPDTEKEG